MHERKRKWEGGQALYGTWASGLPPSGPRGRIARSGPGSLGPPFDGPHKHTHTQKAGETEHSRRRNGQEAEHGSKGLLCSPAQGWYLKNQTREIQEVGQRSTRNPCPPKRTREAEEVGQKSGTRIPCSPAQGWHLKKHGITHRRSGSDAQCPPAHQHGAGTSKSNQGKHKRSGKEV